MRLPDMTLSKTPKNPADPSPHRRRFARALARWREGKGFESAWAFFHQNGGKKAFGLSYNTYMRIENGSRLPSRESLGRILHHLGSSLGYADQRRELLVLFLKALTEGDPLFEPVYEGPSARGADPADDPNELVLRQAAKQQFDLTPTMSAQQMEAMYSSNEAFWCLKWLLTTGHGSTAAELAETLGLKTERAEAALQALTAAKLVELGKGGRFSCPYFASGLLQPRTESVESWLAHSDRIRKRVPAGSSGQHSYVNLVIPADEKTARAIVNLFRDAMFKANLLRPKLPVESGTLLSVEYGVFRLMPIKN